MAIAALFLGLFSANGDSISGPQLAILVGTTAVMLFIVIRTFKRVANHPHRDDLKSMSFFERWRAFKLAKSGERIDDPLDRRLAERFLRYIETTPRFGWRVLVAVIVLRLVNDVVRGGTWEEIIVKHLLFLAIFALPALAVWRLKRRYRETMKANGWSFSVPE